MTLIIRRAQFAALEDALVRERFERTMAAHLRRAHADAVGDRDDARLLAFVREGRRRAQAYGAIDGVAYAQFITLLLLLGERFDEEPWARAVLTAETPTGDARFDALVAAVRTRRAPIR